MSARLLPVSARIHTASEAAALLAAAEAGPYTADEEDGVIWPARETALDPIGAVAGRLNEAQSAANGALLAASWDLAASVVHHADRADRAEAEIERLRADLDLALIHAGNAQRWATGRVMRVTAQASAECERHARELEELRFQLDEMAAVLLAARAGDALSDDLCERARSRSASLTEARAAMERAADSARDVLADLGAPSGTTEEMAAWCREHLARVDAVGDP